MREKSIRQPSVSSTQALETSVYLKPGAVHAGWRFQDHVLTIHIPVPWLGGARAEPFHTGPLTCVCEGADFFCARNDDYQWTVLKARVDADLELITQESYRKLLALQEGHTLLRIWNFVPDINSWKAGQENYRLFCGGRAHAFAHADSTGDLPFPAASAVGCTGKELLIYALASCSGQAIHLENPLQIPAYQYPQHYGPHAPSFSRATAHIGNQADFYVSGTSSILGHQTISPGNLKGQLRQTSQNLDALLEKARHRGLLPMDAAPDWTRAYVRNPEDAPQVEAWLHDQSWVTQGRCSLVQADICRSDLLIEVELSWWNCKTGKNKESSPGYQA